MCKISVKLALIMERLCFETLWAFFSDSDLPWPAMTSGFDYRMILGLYFLTYWVILLGIKLLENGCKENSYSIHFVL